MSHHNSHVGIPKSLIKSYSNESKVYVANLINHKIYPSVPDKTGVIKDYYDDNAELLLSNSLESSLGSLLKNIKSMSKMNDITNYLNSNHSILESFIKFQLQRSKKSLEAFNKHSLTAKVYGELNHSEYIELVSKVDNINMLSLIGGKLFSRVCIANENSVFITNSLGFYFIPDEKNKSVLSFVIPYEPKRAIYIEKFSDEYKNISHYLVPDKHVAYLNKMCSAFEKALGNGILISTESSILSQFVIKKED